MDDREVVALRRTLTVLCSLGRSLRSTIEKAGPEEAGRKGLWLAELLGQLADVGEAASDGRTHDAAAACRMALEEMYAAELQGSSHGGEALSLLDVMAANDEEAAAFTRFKKGIADLARAYGEPLADEGCERTPRRDRAS